MTGRLKWPGGLWKFRSSSLPRLKGGWHDFQYFDHKSSWQWDLWENVLKIFLNYKNFQKIKFSFFQDWNFTPFRGPRQPNFTPFRGPRQPNFTPFRGPRQPNFTPFRGPRQLLWSPLEGWGISGAWQKVSLPKLRNTGAPSTNWGPQWGALL